MLRTFFPAAASLVLASFLVAPAAALVCQLQDNCWTSTTTLSQWTGTPTVICQTGHPVVRIESSSECGQHTAGPAVTLRCGTSTQEFAYSGAHNSDHTLKPTSNWETALWNGCANVEYDAN